jgi:hypothetical protein
MPACYVPALQIPGPALIGFQPARAESRAVCEIRVDTRVGVRFHAEIRVEQAPAAAPFTASPPQRTSTSSNLPDTISPDAGLAWNVCEFATIGTGIAVGSVANARTAPKPSKSPRLPTGS